jgi:hypothetical protein
VSDRRRRFYILFFASLLGHSLLEDAKARTDLSKRANVRGLSVLGLLKPCREEPQSFKNHICASYNSQIHCHEHDMSTSRHDSAPAPWYPRSAWSRQLRARDDLMHPQEVFVVLPAKCVVRGGGSPGLHCHTESDIDQKKVASKN